MSKSKQSPIIAHVKFALLTIFAVLLVHYHSYSPPPPTSPHCATPPSPPSSISPSFDRIHIAVILKRKVTLFSGQKLSFSLSLFLLVCGDIEINPGPASNSISNLIFSHLNVRSATSVTPTLDKPLAISEFLQENKIDILSLSETWLSSNTLDSTLNSLTPSGFSLLHTPRPVGKGGGVAFIYRSFLKLKKLIIPKISSFEAICVQLSISSSSFILLSVYRPPTSSIPVFLSEFSSLLEELVSSPSEILIAGDFNFHVDTPDLAPTSSFLSLLESFDLTQHVNFPTHKLGHTLDLLITRCGSTFLSSFSHTLPEISDHYAILSTIIVPHCPRPSRSVKFIRCFRNINIPSFCNDILNSNIHSSTPTNLDSYIENFSNTLSTILDSHAPLKKVTTSNRPNKPFFTPEIRKEKAKRSRLETIWRKNKTELNRNQFIKQSRYVSKLLTSSRRKYFRELINSTQEKPKTVWPILNKLLNRIPPPCLPSSTSASTLATSFNQFFIDKISKLCSSFVPQSCTSFLLHPKPPFTPPSLDVLSPATNDEVKAAILSSSDATCSLDSIPTFILKSCLHVLLSPITNIVNLSLSEGYFPLKFRHAIISPLFKRHNLSPEDLASYRPVSNLNFISKVIERIVYSRLSKHLDSFPSRSPFQSAYRPLFSTETALLRIQNDILLSVDQQKVTALVLLDMSAAFDTVDHTILLSRLSSYFGISGSALAFLTSYLQNRTQSVSVLSATSSPSPLITGVPQGSILGPLLFSLYTTPLSHLLSESDVSFHFYADDTQLYISFTPDSQSSAMDLLTDTLDSVHTWLTSNMLSVNPSKTEYLLIGTSVQKSKLTSISPNFCGNPLVPTTSARNIGVIFDESLAFKDHINKIIQISYLQIRQLRQIRSVLDLNSAKLLASSLVISKLDYCNSLFYGLPSSTLNRLQRVQNSLARVVVPTVKRHHHISPILKSLHWLPVIDRITFKIATITHKCLHTQQPDYLYRLLQPLPQSSRRSSSKNLLVVPFIKSANGRRSFSFSAPTVWNSLPLKLRSDTSHTSFRSNLKAHLFPP